MLNVDDPVNQWIRGRIRNIRQSKKLSVRKAAAQCGIPESSYSCLENGFYRISLFNLNKMLSGLGATIDEVWPSQQQKAGGENAEWVDQNRFRFQEAVLLSGAKAAVLLRGVDYPQCVFSSNLDESEIAEVAEMVSVGLTRDWTIFSKNKADGQVHLCLLKPSVPPPPGTLDRDLPWSLDGRRSDQGGQGKPKKRISQPERIRRQGTPPGLVSARRRRFPAIARRLQSPCQPHKQRRADQDASHASGLRRNGPITLRRIPDTRIASADGQQKLTDSLPARDEV